MSGRPHGPRIARERLAHAIHGAECPAARLNNIVWMQIPYWVCAIYHAKTITKSMNIENIISEDALYESQRKCSKGVKWKGTVSFYRHHWPDEIGKLSRQLRDGTYKERKPKYFTITEPKKREIMSIHFRDRIYQRSLNDIAIYPQTSRSYIHDNFACQKGKGTMAARDRLKEFLQRYYRKHGTEGYVLQIDIKGYYPNMRHDFAEGMLKSYLDCETYELAKKVLAHLPGKIGYNPGSQIVQIVGITALDKIDHYIKERLYIQYYARYMDDFILLHKDKGYLKYCLSEIERMLKQQGMELNVEKTEIRSITYPIQYLGFVYRITRTGKVVILAAPEKIKHERKKILRMKALVECGILVKRDVDKHFKAFKSSVRYGNSHNLICRLNRWYEGLWKGAENVINHHEVQDYDCGT